jgi:decaprenylphospho-beta-D-ribofuranose 2-oxidase
MSLVSWGMYPKIKNTVFRFDNIKTLRNIITEHDDLIPYGNGRSYGDSALSANIINTRHKDHFIDFKEETGLLYVQTGVLLSEIIEAFVPRGWFLKVTPGTKFITVGGAIASDIHGKNHHIEGCFSECIKEFNIMLADGEIVACSKDATPDLFKATCGGQGLTGVILDAKIYLKKINSHYIDQTSIKTQNLKETFDAFEEYKGKLYSVAWIDCFAKGDNAGAGVLTVGDFRDDGQLDYKTQKQRSIPFIFPLFVLNNWSVRVFNWLYFSKIRQRVSNQRVDINAFFYPLDAIGHWNYIYGKNGFTQYQFILPKESSYRGLQEILTAISESGKSSFLAVLKLYGKSNDNYLSFPMEGYSLALDFKIEKGLFALLDKLDEIVGKYSGRIYLAKDVRVNKKVFEKGYPQIESFRQYRKENKMDLKFQSLQSKRVDI